MTIVQFEKEKRKTYVNIYTWYALYNTGGVWDHK